MHPKSILEGFDWSKFQYLLCKALTVLTASNSGVDDVIAAQVNFVYPPKEKKYTMKSGLSENVFEKENMEKKLKEKVRRNNNLVVEVQGAIIITSK